MKLSYRNIWKFYFFVIYLHKKKKYKYAKFKTI